MDFGEGLSLALKLQFVLFSGGGVLSLGNFKVKMKSLSRVRLFATLWTVAHWAPLSLEFSRQGYWRGFHLLLQGIFLTQRSHPHLLCLLYWQADSLPIVPPGKLTMRLLKVAV